MEDFVVIFSTASSEEEGILIGTKIVEEGLAACTNVVPSIRSIYVWRGELCTDPEVLLIIKTTKRNVNRIVKRVKELHSYEVPEVIALPILHGSEDYLKWMEESLS